MRTPEGSLRGPAWVARVEAAARALGPLVDENRDYSAAEAALEAAGFHTIFEEKAKLERELRNKDKLTACLHDSISALHDELREVKADLRASERCRVSES